MTRVLVAQKTKFKDSSGLFRVRILFLTALVFELTRCANVPSLEKQLDGTWNLASVTCASGAASSISTALASGTTTVTLESLAESAVLTRATTSCTVTHVFQISLNQAGTAQFVESETPTCVPAACDTVCAATETEVWRTSFTRSTAASQADSLPGASDLRDSLTVAQTQSDVGFSSTACSGSRATLRFSAAE